MLVHPTTINTPHRRVSAIFLSRVLDVASPDAAKFPEALTFTKRPAGQGDLDLERESVMGTASSIWHILEWAFYSGGAWSDFINLMVKILRKDFEEVKDEETKESLLSVWLKDWGKEAALKDAVAAILATPRCEMMNNKPQRLYEMDEPKANEEATDVWGGCSLLLARIELLAMAPPIWFIGPNGRFINFH